MGPNDVLKIILFNTLPTDLIIKFYVNYYYSYSDKTILWHAATCWYVIIQRGLMLNLHIDYKASNVLFLAFLYK